MGTLRGFNCSMFSLKQFLRNHSRLWPISRKLYRWLQPVYTNPFSWGVKYFRFFSGWRRYKSLGGSAQLADFYPCLNDNTSETAIDPQYFYQAFWCVSNIFSSAPSHHVDVGSDVKFVGMLSALCQVTFVDIRPLRVKLPQLECRSGTVLSLPFESCSLKSVSSLHVIEHIGLGRYGDPLDPNGSDKACKELMRVVAPGGKLYVSTPIGSPRVQFNGQRVFSINEVCTIFAGMQLVSFSLVDNFGEFHQNISSLTVNFDEVQGQDFALGCFEFVKKD
jgi:hypothetical protein